MLLIFQEEIHELEKEVKEITEKFDKNSLKYLFLTLRDFSRVYAYQVIVQVFYLLRDVH